MSRKFISVLSINQNVPGLEKCLLLCIAVPPVPAWKCQLALAITQVAFCCGSVYLKRALRAVDGTRGHHFHPIIYAFVREAIAGPIMCSLAWGFSSEQDSVITQLLTTGASCTATPSVLAGTLPKQSDLLHVGALGVCLFFNQLMYILGISLSGVLVATCMQPTIPVFTAMLAVCLQLESGSVQKFFGIGLAVVGSMSMVSSKHTCLCTS